MILPPSTPTRRWSLSLGGSTFDLWHRAELIRDLSEISASFQLELIDTMRSTAALPSVSLAAMGPMVVAGLECRLTIDGVLALVGWVDDINPVAAEGGVHVTVTGRDKTGDLVDCAATVNGPSEFKGLDLLEITKRIVAPFGLTARADVDVGDPFPRYTIDPGETAMSAIEKGARQRALLVTSDGVGAVVLTRSGKTRAPGDLTFPGNVVSSSASFSMRERFSDYWVKGQAEGGGGIRAASAPLDGSATSLDAIPPPPALPAGRERAGTSIYGHAVDSEVKRYRPTVTLARTQTGPKGAQAQADWMMRTARARSEKLDYEVLGYGAGGGLWQPNTLAAVDDGYQAVTRDMLIAGVVYMYGDDGARTALRITGPEAYDLLPEATDKGSRKNRKGKAAKGKGGKLDTTATPL